MRLPDRYESLYSLADRTVVVTGACGLIGKAISRCLASAGANLIVADINETAGGELCLQLRNAGLQARFWRFDQSELDSAESEIGRLFESAGAIDGWVNNAYPRTADWALDLPEVSIESWRKNVDMQMNSYCWVSAIVAQRMKVQRKGSVVNIGSIQSVVAPDFTLYEGLPMTSPAAYSAIKGGILNFSRYLASYFGPNNVRINVVCPGGVANNQPQLFVDRYSKRTPLRRLATPEEIAPPVQFLLSDAASYITGVALMVDGGLTAI